MIKTVASAELPVGEKLRIQKHVISPGSLTGSGKRICIVTGTHGDELEGQYVCCLINERIRQHTEYLAGTVELYPALNPLGVDSITRGIPMFDLDMNRTFPGTENGNAAEYIASKIVEDLEGADLCIDIHASNIFLREVPQVRMSEDTAETLLPFAKKLNVDFVWVHAAATVLEATLAHSMNMRGVPTLVVEMGVGMRITKEYGEQLTDGIFQVMKELGIWTGPVSPVKEPVVSEDGEVGFVNAEEPGLFVPSVPHWTNVEAGQEIGRILNPLDGTCLLTVKSPIKGKLFTLREYPMVSVGSLLARVLGGEFS